LVDRQEDSTLDFGGNNENCETSKRQVDGIQIHVIGGQRSESLKSLLHQLDESNYDGWEIPVPIYIHLDGGSLPEVRTIVDKFQWTHGEKRVDKRRKNVGLRDMWLSSLGAAAKAAGENTLMIVFEDNMIVSSSYFQWILAAIHAYGKSTNCRNVNLMGFSLSPITADDLSTPPKPWNPKFSGVSSYAYLSAMPSSWGAAYWSDRWIEFSEFVDVRMKPPYYNLHAEKSVDKAQHNENLRLTPEELFIPKSRFNYVSNNWKRFMIDWMYARGLVMVYPNHPGEAGFASTKVLSEENGRKSSGTNLGVAELADSFDYDMGSILMPKYVDLPVVGLYLEPTNMALLAIRGNDFLNEVRGRCPTCDPLLKVWAKPESFPSQSLDGGFAFCAPDLYKMSSESRVSLESQPPKHTQKFLLYEPQYGGNNQLYAIVEAIKWADTLGRRLIIPPVLLPRVSEFSHEEWPVTQKILRLTEDNGRGLHPNLIEFQQWMELKIPVARVLRISRDAKFDKRASAMVNHISEITGATNIPIVDLQHLIPTKILHEDLVHLFSGCHDEVLAFDSMFHVNHHDKNGDWVDNFDVFVDIFRLSEKAQRAYNAVKRQLTEKLGQTQYACYHVRLGDFIPMCEELKEMKGNPSFQYWNEMLEQGHKCALTPDEVVMGVLSRSMPALLLSNDNPYVESRLEAASVASVSSKWVQDRLAEERPLGMNEAEFEVLTMLIEQQLCGEAEYALLNKFSTFSARIKAIKRGVGYEYWGVQAPVT